MLQPADAAAAPEVGIRRGHVPAHAEIDRAAGEVMRPVGAADARVVAPAAARRVHRDRTELGNLRDDRLQLPAEAPRGRAPSHAARHASLWRRQVEVAAEARHPRAPRPARARLALPRLVHAMARTGHAVLVPDRNRRCRRKPGDRGGEAKAAEGAPPANRPAMVAVAQHNESRRIVEVPAMGCVSVRELSCIFSSPQSLGRSKMAVDWAFTP